MPKIVIDFVALLVTAYQTAGPTTQFLIKLAGAALLSVASSKLFGPKMPSGAGFSGLQVTTRGALEFRKIVYGEAMVSGPIVYMNVTGSDREYLWHVIALAEGLSEDVTAVWLDGDEIPKADISWTAGSGASDGTGTGEVSTAKWVGDNSTKAVNLFYYLGSATQPACGVLDTEFADITTSFRLRGVTYLVTKFLYDVDTERVWENGKPANIKAVVKGRLIYDPREVSHDFADATTWAWSENPALCIADYLTQIMGVAEDSIDWTSIEDAADDCEVSVAKIGGTEDRFTCNGALSLGSSHKDNLDLLLSSCDGKLSYTGGIWKLRASVWEASSVSITENDLAADINVQGSASEADRFNTIRGYFIDPNRKYESVEFPHVIDAAYLARDNGKVIAYDMSLPMTNTETMAQRIAFRNLEQSDNQITCETTLNAVGAKIAIGDVVDLTVSSLSWSAKTFRVIEWERNANGTFKVTLREDNSEAYTDPIEGDYSASNTGGVTVPSDLVPAPTGLAVTAVSSGMELSWTNPPAATYDYIDIYEDTDNSWTGATKVARVRADTYTVPHTYGSTTYYYWIRAVRLPDLESARSPDSDTSTVALSTATLTLGKWIDVKFKRDNEEPSTPTGDNPSGWYDYIPNGTSSIWQVSGDKNSAGTLIGTWSTPERIEGLTYRGSWAVGDAYLLNHVVTYSERTYVCVLANTGNAPSGTNSGNTWWDLLAGKGDTGSTPTAFNETIAITGTGPVNLRTLADEHASAYDGVGDATITYTLASGVTITGSPGSHGINTGTWPDAATIALTLQITGTVRGGGGSGGAGGRGLTGGNGSPGTSGGDAIYLQEAMTGGITVNSGGLVQAGGGGAGGGGGASYPSDEPDAYGGGGGGGGFPNGAGGAAGVGLGASAGAAGTTSGGGTGGGGGGTAGDGGDGGDVNVNGDSGAAGVGSFKRGSGGSGGSKGYAIRKNGHSATVTNNGTITGTQG